MIILVGASASGKTEVAKLLGQHYDIRKVITHTTRAIRPSEKLDVDYHFVDKDAFLSLKNQQCFVETTLYNDNYYGTSKKEIGDNKVLIVDPNGLDAFLKLRDNHIVSFYLNSRDETRLRHMRERGDSFEDANKRIATDKMNFTEKVAEKCHYIIDSDRSTLEQMAKNIFALYQEHLKKF